MVSYNCQRKGIKKGNRTMRKETYQNNLSYIFEADRKNAKYSIDGGEHFMNHGDYCECLAKSVLGFDEFCKRFFADELPNTQYIWVHDYGEMVDLYFMNEIEMKEFTKFAAKYYEYEQKVRFKLCENKIVQYLDERVA